MQKVVSLKQNKDFLRLYYRGKSCAKPAIVVYAMKNRVGVCRMGITTSKKIGNAVERNRSRRVIKAAFSQVLFENTLSGSWDLVFVARSKTKYVKSTKLALSLKECLEQVGAIK